MARASEGPEEGAAAAAHIRQMAMRGPPRDGCRSGRRAATGHTVAAAANCDEAQGRGRHVGARAQLDVTWG